MRIFAVLTAITTFPCALFAQVTWQGLPFGSSVAHVRTFLARQLPVCTNSSGDDNDCVGFTLEELPGGQSGDWTVKPAPELWLAALSAPLHFKTLLHFFNADQQLARVDLILDVGKYKAEGKQDSDLVDFAGEPILAELLVKYGVPLEMSAACEPAEARRLLRTHADLIDCNALWKAPGQTVNLIWKYVGSTRAYSLVVRYASIQSGL